MEGGGLMIWYDREADYLEMNWLSAAGGYRRSDLDGVWERVDAEGRILGIAITGIERSRRRWRADPLRCSQRSTEERTMPEEPPSSRSAEPTSPGCRARGRRIAKLGG